MKLLLVSDAVLWDKTTKAPFPRVAEAMAELAKLGNAVFLVSSHAEPAWLKAHFPSVRFQACPFAERMNGNIVRALLKANEANGLKVSDVVVLGAKKNDLLMAVQSKTLLVRCEWSNALEAEIKKYGLPIHEPAKLPLLVSLLKDEVPWYFKHTSPVLDVYTLTNAGTYGETDALVLKLVEKLTGCLKNGEIQFRNEFAAHFMSSLCVTEVFREVDWWGWYPSSKAGKENEEVMRHFCTLARTTFGRRTKGHLFVRHTDAERRHYKKEGREDPTTELETIHINPAYEKQLVGKTVAVLDDYLTYGLSFGVATTLLQKAGVKKVIGVAMGKFGNRAQTYKIGLGSDEVFEPLDDFALQSHTTMTGGNVQAAQKEFVAKFRELIK